MRLLLLLLLVLVVVQVGQGRDGWGGLLGVVLLQVGLVALAGLLLLGPASCARLATGS